MTFDKSRLASGSILVVVISLLIFASACGGGSGSSSNSVAAPISVATPTFSPVAGTFTTAQMVTISDTAGASILYCEDQTNTCTPSTPYSSALSITSTIFLRAQATASGMSASAVANGKYIIGSPSTPLSSTCGSSAPNCATLTVDAGPTGLYVNGAFTDVKVCVPGSSSSCTTVSHVLVDTGSVGLRLMKSLVPIALTQSTASGGGALIECYPFVASYMWGPVATADIQIAGETASGAPIMLIDDAATPAFAAPTTCSSYGGPPALLSANTVGELGANGILGIGSTQQDCGPYCVQSASLQVDSANEFVGLYYSCTGLICAPTSAALLTQVPQPVSQFATDNNGTAISLPSVPSTGVATVTGALYFGIGNQFSNPMPSAATVLMLASKQFITTTYKSVANTHSFIDSGSNGYFFADSTIAECDITSAGSGWFCPATPFSSSGINSGATGSSGSSTVPFSLASATTLFTNNNGLNNAFSNLGALGATNTFDWGLPFFYGRVVYNGIDQKPVTNSGGTTFTGPFVAY